jgi:mannitol-1-phosphate/altronate dehydrogenase
MAKTLVCFGFGPIAAGLFVYEAWRSGHFNRLVVAEVDGDLVEAVRKAGGAYHVNIAGPDGIETCRIDGLELLNPNVAEDRLALLEALAASDEWATCLPSVDFYDRGSPSVSDLLAEAMNLCPRTRRIVYTAENNNHAAEILIQRLAEKLGHTTDRLCALNTVIGKMSGVIQDAPTRRKLGLRPVCPGLDRAILIEQFNRILISRVDLEDYRRGIEVFLEKPDLLPFEEAKLYGHNAIHALIAYLADFRGLETIAQAADHADIMQCASKAFLDESGTALLTRHRNVDDPLFRPEGFAQYARDLLERMVNPYLNDLVSRVGRDHARKLGYHDRLYGTMRLALESGVRPVHLARGAAAGLVSMVRRREQLQSVPHHLPESPDALGAQTAGALLRSLWQEDARHDEHADELIGLTLEGLDWLGESFGRR